MVGAWHGPDGLSPHGPPFLPPFVPAPAGIQLGHRDRSPYPDPCPQLHGIPPPLGSTGLLGNHRRNDHYELYPFHWKANSLLYPGSGRGGARSVAPLLLAPLRCFTFLHRSADGPSFLESEEGRRNIGTAMNFGLRNAVGTSRYGCRTDHGRRGAGL